MPPATPSPHRFISTARKTQSSRKEDKAPSLLRRQLPQTIAEPDNASHTNQFAQTPRFSHGKSRLPAQPVSSASPPNSTLVRALRAGRRPAEDAEDVAATEDDDEMLLDQSDQPEGTTAHAVSEDQNGHQWTNDLAFSPKRRRIDHNDAQLPPAQMESEDLPTMGSLLTTNGVPRFTHSFTQATQSSVSMEVGNAQRPAFIRPAVQTQEPSEPLPDAFSPHRRGQKFVAGGMAATLQQWVLETGHTAVQSRNGQNHLRGENYVMRVKVDEVKGDGPFILRAKVSNGDQVDVLLAVGTRSGNSESQEVRVGCVIGIRAPTWDIDLDSKTYAVGVDWKVISRPSD